MNKFSIRLIILLFVGLILSDVHKMVYFIWPHTANIEYDLFLQNSFHQKITILWYIYELADFVNKVIMSFVFCKVALLVSEKLFKAGVVFVLYYASQIFFYMWNRNTSFLTNYILYMCIVVILYIIFSPHKDKSKYKSINGI